MPIRSVLPDSEDFYSHMLTDDESFVAKQAPEITDDSSQDEFYDSVESHSQFEGNKERQIRHLRTPVTIVQKTDMPKSRIPVPQFKTSLRPKMLDSRVRKYRMEKMMSSGGTTSRLVVKRVSNGRQSLLPRRKISVNNTINFNEQEFLNSTRISILPGELQIVGDVPRQTLSVLQDAATKRGFHSMTHCSFQSASARTKDMELTPHTNGSLTEEVSEDRVADRSDLQEKGPKISFEEGCIEQDSCGDFSQSSHPSNSNVTNKRAEITEDFTNGGTSSLVYEGEDCSGNSGTMDIYDDDSREDGGEGSKLHTDSQVFRELAPSPNISFSMSYGFRESFAADSDNDSPEIDEDDITIEKKKIEECHLGVLRPGQFRFFNLNPFSSSYTEGTSINDITGILTHKYNSGDCEYIDSENQVDYEGLERSELFNKSSRQRDDSRQKNDPSNSSTEAFAVRLDEDIQILENSVNRMSLQRIEVENLNVKTPTRRVFLDDSDFEPHEEGNKENNVEEDENDGESELDEDYEDSDEVDEVELSRRKKPKSSSDQDEAYLLSLSGLAITPRNRDTIVDRLIDIYDRRIFDGRLPQLEFEWNARLRKTAGQYYSSSRDNHKDLIKLAVKVLTSGERLRNTLLHELCHCAVSKINNEKEGHGKYFKQWAKHIAKVFPMMPPITTRHNYEINYKYEYICQNCSGKVKRHSPSVDLATKCCGRCHGRFDLYKDGRIWKRVEVDAITKKNVVISV